MAHCFCFDDRYGFNSEGHKNVLKRLEERKKRGKAFSHFSQSNNYSTTHLIKSFTNSIKLIKYGDLKRGIETSVETSNSVKF